MGCDAEYEEHNAEYAEHFTEGPNNESQSDQYYGKVWQAIAHLVQLLV